jgi:hypothetical protein
MLYRPKCETCGEPCAIWQDYDDTRAGSAPWCENDECEDCGEPVEVDTGPDFDYGTAMGW